MSNVAIANSALGLLKLLPESAKKIIARTIDGLVSGKDDSVSVPYDPDLRMTRAGEYRLIYKPEKTGSSLLVLSIYRPEDSQRIEEILKEHILKNPPAELVSLLPEGKLFAIHELWVESDQTTANGRRIVGTGSAEIHGFVKGLAAKEEAVFAFEAMLNADQHIDVQVDLASVESSRTSLQQRISPAEPFAAT